MKRVAEQRHGHEARGRCSLAGVYRNPKEQIVYY
jgi:hypothetical protein